MMPIKDCDIGENVKIWESDLVNLYGCSIGDNVNIGAFTEIGPGVTVGTGTRIGAQCFIPEGIEIGKNVWIGPGVKFANDKYPPSGRDVWTALKTEVEDNVVIGMGAIILPGLRLGTGAMIGAGAVVTKDVPPGATWVGLPAAELKRQDGYKSKID